LQHETPSKIKLSTSSSGVMEKEPQEKKIDGNAIVSPKNTRKLYGKKPLDKDEVTVEPEPPITLPDGADENMFPSAP